MLTNEPFHTRCASVLAQMRITAGFLRYFIFNLS
jgi:hypothetical protein